MRDIDRKRKNTVFSTNFSQLIETSKKLLLQEKNTPKFFGKVVNISP